MCKNLINPLSLTSNNSMKSYYLAYVAFCCSDLYFSAPDKNHFIYTSLDLLNLAP